VNAKINILKASLINVVVGIVCFWVDFRTGVFGAGYILVLSIMVYAIRIVFNRLSGLHLFFSSAPLTISLVAIILVGLISKDMVWKERNRIVEKAEVFKNESGKYPSSLSELGASTELDRQGRMRVGSSQLFLIDGDVVCIIFPGKLIIYNLEKKSEIIKDVI
jgi:hypothetical protein